MVLSRIQMVGIVGIAVLLFQGCASSGLSAIDDDLQSEVLHLKGAIYAGGKIWQDQPDNATRKVEYDDAKNPGFTFIVQFLTKLETVRG